MQVWIVTLGANGRRSRGDEPISPARTIASQDRRGFRTRVGPNAYRIDGGDLAYATQLNLEGIY